MGAFRISAFLKIPGAAALIVVAGLAVCGGRTADAQIMKQEDGDLFELVLQVKRGDELLSGGILGFQKGYTGYYLPFGGLMDILGIYHETDIASGTVNGWFVKPENTYSINAATGRAAFGETQFEILPDALIVKDFGAGYGDVFIRVEALNTLLPLNLELDFSKLQLLVNAERKLPYELKRDREEKRDRLLANQDRLNIQTRGFETVDNDYKNFSLPVLDINSSGRWNKTDGTIDTGLSVLGKNDLLGFSADYGLDLNYQDNDLVTPDNLRMTLTRREFGEDPMLMGVRELRIGDVSARTSDLVNGSNTGRGVSVSSAPLHRAGTFDEVTVEGIASPGWEIELYRNEELIDFGVVDGTGQYRFDDVALLAGVNRIRVALYGPAGQVEERVEEYTLGGSLLPGGEFEYEASVVDTTSDLIPLKDDSFNGYGPNTDDQGIAYSGAVRAGVNRWMSVFATASDSATRGGKTKYVTAGTNLALGGALTSIEAYQQVGGGRALDARLATNFMGWRAKLRTEVLNDFESNRVGFGDSAKVSDVQASLSKRFATHFGQTGVTLSANREKEQSGDSTARYQISNFFSRSKQNYGNRLTAHHKDGKLTQVDGFANATFRLGKKLHIRNTLNYEVQPHFEWESYSADMNYRYSKNLNTGLNLGYNLNTAESTVGTNVSYDFGKFLGSLNTNWNSEGATTVTLRASTSLAPYGEDGRYLMSSQSMREQSALNGRVFMDSNLNGLYDGDEGPVEGAALTVNRRATDDSDPDGNIGEILPGSGDVVALEFSKDSTDNPFHASKEAGYKVLLRPGVRQDLDFPLVETGMIDGIASFENGSPVPGLRLQLVDAEDRVIKDTITSFDGFYTFEFVKPGAYVLRTDPALGLNVEPRTIVIEPDSLFAYGTNMQLSEKPSSAVQVDSHMVQSNTNLIVDKLIQLQSALRSASAL